MLFLTLFPSFAYSFWVSDIWEKARKSFLSLQDFFFWSWVAFFLWLGLVKTHPFNFTASALVFNLSTFPFANILLQLGWVSPWSMDASIRNNTTNMIAQPHQTSSTLTTGTHYLPTRHFNFIFSNNNPNYVVFLRKNSLWFSLYKTRKFWNLYSECSLLVKSVGDFVRKSLAVSWKYIAGQLIMTCSFPIHFDMIAISSNQRSCKIKLFLALLAQPYNPCRR